MKREVIAQCIVDMLARGEDLNYLANRLRINKITQEDFDEFLSEEGRYLVETYK